jgi:thymidylate kinase
MRKEEMIVYDEWYNWLTKENNVHVDLTVYLRASPDTCYERIKSRSRTEESQISKKYIEQLHSLHESWLISDAGISKRPSPVIVIPANGTREEMLQRFEKLTPYILGGKEWSPELDIFAEHRNGEDASLAKVRA